MVEIETEDSIYDDNEINEMSQKIANAILHHVNHSEEGITPENSETFTKMIRVKGWYQDKEIIEHTDADFIR